VVVLRRSLKSAVFAAAGPLRSPYRLPALPASGEHQLLRLNVILRSSRHSDLFRSCLHSSYDTPLRSAVLYGVVEGELEQTVDGRFGCDLGRAPTLGASSSSRRV
jgi:hypothetical protein